MINAYCKNSIVSQNQGHRNQASIRVSSSRLGNWLPGSVTPPYLENISGSYGFDPLGLGAIPANLTRYQEAEIIHCRWAMLGVVGALSVEALGFGNWYDAPLANKQTYFGVEIPFELNTLISIEIVFMGVVEAQRLYETDRYKKLYPGFDFVGIAKV